MVWKLLKDNGFNVLTAGNAEAAMQISRNHPGHIDLLLADIEMPGMGGFDLYGQISKERQGIKVIFMAGDLQGREQVAMNRLPFLQKPFTFKTMQSAIKLLLGPVPPLQ